MVLFFGRTLYDYLHLKLKGKVFVVFICFLSIIGFCFGLIQWLPFSFDIALAIQPLFLFGQWLKKFDMKTKANKTCLISLITWAVSFIIIYMLTGSYMELACRRYSVFPICFLCAIAGAMFVCSFSQIFSHLKRISVPLKYLGKNSIYMLWVHCFDGYFSFVYNITPHGMVNTIFRVIIDLIIFVIVMVVIENIKRIRTQKRQELNVNLYF
jgi:fucose 4-O-acetylase-like acetyltransferase